VEELNRPFSYSRGHAVRLSTRNRSTPISTLSLRIPTSLHRELRDLADREGISINQMISAAVGEKVASLKTMDYLRERAQRGRRNLFDAVLAKVPDVEPEEVDKLPHAYRRLRRSKHRSRVSGGNRRSNTERNR
jgi:hypothetical protein